MAETSVRHPASERRSVTQAFGKAADWLLAHPFILISALLAVQTIPALWSKDVWLPDEVRHAAVFLQMIENGHWLALQLGENFYPDKPPVYFWLLGAIWSVLRTTDPVLFMVAAALSAWAYLLAHSWTARVLGFPVRTATVACLLLLANWFFIERAHQPRMDLLFAVFIVLAHAGFFRAVQGQRKPAMGWSVFGFAMAAAAVLVKGPLGVLFPVLTLVVHMARQRRLRDLVSPAMGFGLALFVAVMAAYLGGVTYVKGRDFIEALIFDQTIDRGINAGTQSKPFFFYFGQLALAFLPWTLVLLLAPWRMMTRRDWWTSRLRAAPDEDPGRAFAATALVSGVLFLSLLDYKNAFFLVPFMGWCAILTADVLDRASRAGRRLVFLLAAGLYLVVAVVAPFASDFTVWPIRIEGLIPVAIGIGLTAALMAWAAPRRPQIAALVTAAGLSLVAVPLYTVTMASLNPVMSPRVVGGVLRDLADRGYTLAQYHRFNLGDLDYHTGRPIRHFSQMRDLTLFALTEPCGAVSILRSYHDQWQKRPIEFEMEIVHEYRLDANDNLVIAWSNGTCG